ncbi:MAG: hypothetical protein Q8O56_04135 [Solirubrobacteraceae bacterium]|nr:hypothetical protein [Solirubrobacteraceae bacterium]
MPLPRTYVLPRSRLARATLTTVVVGALLALGVAGYAIGRGGEDVVATAPGQAAETGAVALRYPVGWSQRARPPAMPGLNVEDPIVLSAGGGAGLVAGIVADATGPDLLPRALRRRLPRAPESEPVRLGGIEALRYPYLQVRGFDGVLTLYAIPTARGSVVVACSFPAHAGAFFGDCERSAVTLRLDGLRAYPIGPDAGYGRRLAAAIGAIDTAMTQHGARLEQARTAAGQASIGARLARSLTAIGATLDVGPVSARDREGHAKLVAAIDASASAYRALSDAARAGDAYRYERAAATVRTISARLRDAGAALASLGYMTAGAQDQ